MDFLRSKSHADAEAFLFPSSTCRKNAFGVEEKKKKKVVINHTPRPETSV